ncbi:hypothetical protein F66182_8363 [Fusarium sp. NRRL 66182]|nr:hypothetical protein F66182_8363 [Fusarium sp. NRRL 66182]
MTEVPPGHAGMDDSDEDSIASTIHTDHDSDEEWNVNGVLAQVKVDDTLLYLIKWDGYELHEASWEPIENLNEKIIDDWKKTKSQKGFDQYQNIREWKAAFKLQYDERFARHQKRNQLRLQRGREPTSFQHMEETLAYYNKKIPDYEKPQKSPASNPLDVTVKQDADVGRRQSLQSFEKRKLSNASLCDNRSPKSSRRNSDADTRKASPAQTGAATSTITSTTQRPPPRRESATSSKGHEPLRQKPAQTNSLLTAKFGRPKPLKRVGSETNEQQMTARKTQNQVFTGNVFAGGKTRKTRTTLAEVAKDPTKQPKLMKHRYARIIEKAGRDREAAAPARLPSDLISLNPAEQQTNGLNYPSNENIEADQGGLSHHGVGETQHNAPSPDVGQKPTKSKPKKSISWGPIEETIIPTSQEPAEFVREESSIFIREASIVSTIKKDESLEPNIPEPTPEPATRPTRQTNQPARRVRWAVGTPDSNDDTSPSIHTMVKDVRFGPGTRDTMSVIFEKYPPHTEQPWPALLESEPKLIFTHTCMAQDFRDQEESLVGEKLGNGSLTSNGNPTSLAEVANWLRSICGNRKALLITPSFVVSQPQQLWNFFKWFWKCWGDSRDSFRLVVCADFQSWILGVAAEKNINRMGNDSNVTGRPRQDVVNEEAVKALKKTWMTARALIYDLSTEEHPAFVFAPRSIDGNDEQSLVNWFGWWSVMNLDRFRKFSVVGSSATDPRGLTRHFTRPEFTTSTSADPDDLYRILDRADSNQNQLHAPSTGQVTSHSRTKLQLIPGDDAASFRHFLKTLDESIKGNSNWCPHQLYHWPVAYWNADMAYDFSDYHSGFATFSKCLKYWADFIHAPVPNFHNTGIALCYTTEGTWRANQSRENLSKKRRPWIAIYRPVEPHIRPWRSTELLIWDPIQKGHLGRDAKVYEEDLIEAQRQMIKAIRKDLGEKLPLEKVWLSGLDGEPKGLTEPVDITIHHLQMFMDNLKANVPAPVQALPLRGWKRVQAGSAPYRSMPNSPASSREPSPEPMDIDDTSDTDNTADEGLRTVFHPPRGKQLNRPTNCKNRLFQHCTNEKIRNRKREAMEYRFRPTVEWYRHQVDEGRGFEHIRVTTWESVFEEYLIDRSILKTN